ncbi:MAG: hypothetical protein HY744_22975 [Deltaproteobacteria bacterium]|nr:hypothetical protein [Deltaproteobacteria bacterium]
MRERPMRDQPQRPSLRVLVTALALGAALLVARPSLGQLSAAAEALFDEGREAMAAGAYATACAKFHESDRIDSAPGTKLNLGECELKRGRIATAWELFRAVSAQVPPGDPRLALAQRRAAELEPRLPRVVFGLLPGSPANTTVRFGTAELGAGSFGLLLPVDPGTHQLVVSAPGHESRTFTLRIGEAERSEIKVGPGPKGAPAAPSGSGAARGPEAGPPGFWGRHEASVLVGGGAVLLGGVGLGLGAATSSSYADLAESCAGTAAGCAQGDIDAAQGKAVATNLLLGAAGLAAATSAVLFLLVEDSAAPASAGTAGRDRAARPSIALAPAPGGAALRLRF